MLYNEVILDHYRNPRNFGEIKDYSFVLDIRNPICGDEIKLFVKCLKKKVIDISFYGMGCAISTAAASLMTESIKGKTIDELKKLNIKKIFKPFESELVGHKMTCVNMSVNGLREIVRKAEKCK